MAFGARIRPTFTSTIRNRTWGAAVVALVSGCGGSAFPPTDSAAPPAHDHPANADAHGGVVVDPRVTAEVTLDQILAYADAQAPSLAVARSARAEAAAARAAASPLLPANPEVAVGVGPRFEGDAVGVDFEVGLSQQIEIAGERGLRMDAAESVAVLTEAEIEEQRWEIHADVHAAFVRAQLERERTELARQTLSFQEGVVEVVRRQAQAGEIPPLNLRLAEAEVAQARQSVVAAEQGEMSARIRLATLAGWPVAKPPLPIGDVPAPREPPSLEALSRSVRGPHPAVRARRAALREAEARADLAGREAVPDPTIGATYARESAPAGGTENHVVLGTVSMPIPLWQTNQAERARADADRSMAEARLDATGQLLEGRVAEARIEVVAAAQRVQSYGTEVLPRLEENLQLLRRSYEVGEIDLITLSAGKERFLRIQNDALAARIDYFLAVANLERVVGVELHLAPAEGEATP